MAIAESLKKLQMKFVFRKDAEIGGNKYTLQVLSMRDEQKVQSIPTEGIDGIAYINEVQKMMLSHAIRSIDGEEIPDIIEVVGSEGKTETKERAIYLREEVVERMPGPMIERLFEVYADMRDEKEKEINSSLTYSWYKTPGQREKEREERARAEKEREERARAERESAEKDKASKTEATESANGVPSPDAKIELKELPRDFADDAEPSKKE